MRTLRPYAPALLAVATVALLSWPVTGDLQASTDLDGAWQIALNQGVHDGLNYGPDMLFTYGPLGFLHRPLLVYPWPARFAFMWVSIAQVAVAAGLVWSLRHALRSWWLAVLVAIPIAVVLGRGPGTAIAFFAAVALAGGQARGRTGLAVAAGLGVLAGLELLIKLNTGVTVAALGVVAVAVAPGPRRGVVLAFAAGAAAALLGGWVATGQSLGGVVDYVIGSLGIISGYSEAMIYEEPMREWEPWAAALLFGIGALVAWRAGEALPRRAQVGLVLLWTVLAFTAFKAAFVRHDAGHTNIYFASVLGALIAFGWAPHRRQTAWLLGALFAVTLLASGGPSPRAQFMPLLRADSFFDQVRLLTDGSATNEGIAAARKARADFEQLDGRIYDAIGDRTVHVEPTDAGLPWAQRLRWKPLPVFQSYSAYTADLDDRNADMVRSPDGPEVILREATVTFDNRIAAFESPAAIVAMLCHFRPTEGPYGRWLLLERSPDRCGPERPLKTVDARLGEAVPVPPPPDRSSIVVVHIEGVEVSGLEKIRAALHRSRGRQVVYDGGREIKRLIPGTAANAHILTVPRRADHPDPLRLDQGVKTIAVLNEDREGDVRFRFTTRTIR
jgi:hypothetical protein